MRDIESPIFVTGNARQGTTFQQWFLTSHPRIHIFGQETIELAELSRLYAHLVVGGDEAARANRRREYDRYRVEHWAGSDRARTRRLYSQFVCDYLTGLGDNTWARWGLKSPWQASNAASTTFIEDLFPLCKWIVCFRDPFVSFG